MDTSEQRAIPQPCCACCGAILSANQKRFCSWACRGLRQSQPIEPRFWSKVIRSDDGCWLWSGWTSRGYGCIKVGGKKKLSHRVSWELHNGPVPDGLFVCHHCDTPGCVRPDHLFLGTSQENSADRDAKGRQAKGSKTHRKHIPRGEGHTQSKLQECDVIEIRTLYASGAFEMSALARRFGVTRNLVSEIVNGKIWTHLLPEHWVNPNATLQSKPVIITHEGRSLSRVAWSAETGLPTSTIASRLKRGWTVKRTLETPAGVCRFRHSSTSPPTWQSGCAPKRPAGIRTP